MRYVATDCSPRAISSRTSASSPDTRSESSCEITSAATFFPAKLTEPASGDRQTDVNFGAADTSVTATTMAAKVAGRRCFMR